MGQRCSVQIGETYGMLTITDIVSVPDGSSNRALCNTKCACGNTKDKVRPSFLTKGRVQSCGCLLTKANGRSRTKEYQLLAAAKKRAAANNLDFNIEYEDIRIPAICPLLEIPIVSTNTHSVCDNSPSIDRIKPCLGYIKGNIWVISALANRIKSNATPDQISLLATNLLCLQNSLVVR